MKEDNKNIKPDNNSDETPVEKAPVEEVVSEEATTEEEAPIEEVVSEEATTEEEAPVEEVVAEEATTEEEAPIEEAPVEEVVAEENVHNDKFKESLDLPFIIGKKVGMTRLFDNDGKSYPVTLIEAGPCYITQIKSKDKDGYSSIQLGFSETNEKKINKPQQGHLKNKYLKYLKEYKTSNSSKDFSVGGEINVGLFDAGDIVNISGISKGKGFAGHMKRYNFSGGRASHGKNSVMRKSGSVGAGTDPGRIFPGMKMAGRMGNDRVTVKNLEVLNIDYNNNLIFIKGALPGSNNNYLYLTKK